MSIKRKILATVVVLATIVIGIYVLIANQPNPRGGGVLADPPVRTFVTLTTVGVSAFITGSKRETSLAEQLQRGNG